MAFNFDDITRTQVDNRAAGLAPVADEHPGAPVVDDDPGRFALVDVGHRPANRYWAAVASDVKHQSADRRDFPQRRSCPFRRRCLHVLPPCQRSGTERYPSIQAHHGNCASGSGAPARARIWNGCHVWNREPAEHLNSLRQMFHVVHGTVVVDPGAQRLPDGGKANVIAND